MFFKDIQTELAVTSDNKYIVSGSADKTIRIWNLLEIKQEAVLEAQTDYVRTIALSGDNNYIISGSHDKQ